MRYGVDFEGVPEAIVEILWAIGIIWESHQSLANSSWFASKKNMDRSVDFEGVPEAIVEILWAIEILWESHQSLANSSG